jgi:hypothetical protein
MQQLTNNLYSSEIMSYSFQEISDILLEKTLSFTSGITAFLDKKPYGMFHLNIVAENN